MKSSHRASQRPKAGAGAICLLLCAALASCSGAETVAPAPEIAAIPPGVDASSPAQRRLITESQYLNTVGHIFGRDIEVIAQFAPMKLNPSGYLAKVKFCDGIPAGLRSKIRSWFPAKWSLF